MAKAVYMINGKKSNSVEYPTEQVAEDAMKEEMQELAEPGLVGKVYALYSASTFTCDFIELPTNV